MLSPQWLHIDCQLRIELRQEVALLRSTQPMPPIEGTPVDEATARWCADVYALHKQVSQLQAALFRADHILGDLRGRDASGPPPFPYPRPEKGK